MLRRVSPLRPSQGKFLPSGAVGRGRKHSLIGEGELHEMTFARVYFILAIDSESLTDFLGIAAIVAFSLTALWVLAIVLMESARAKRLQGRSPSASAAWAREEARRQEFAAEVKRIEEEYAEFYETAMIAAKSKLGELTRRARASLSRIAAAYSRHCRNYEREHADALSARFTQACDRQWRFFKDDLGYIGFNDVEPHLRSVLECQELFERFGDAEGEVEAGAVETAPGIERAKELRELLRTIPSERLGMLQMEAIEAIAPFSSYYEKYTKDWLNDALFGIVNKLRKRGSTGASIRDTDLKQRFTRLKHALETMGRLSERLESNLQEKGEQKAAFAQIVFAGVALAMLAAAPEWFPEIGDPSQEPAMAAPARETTADGRAQQAAAGGGLLRARD